MFLLIREKISTDKDLRHECTRAPFCLEELRPARHHKGDRVLGSRIDRSGNICRRGSSLPVARPYEGPASPLRVFLLLSRWAQWPRTYVKDSTTIGPLLLRLELLARLIMILAEWYLRFPHQLAPFCARIYALFYLMRQCGLIALV